MPRERHGHRTTVRGQYYICYISCISAGHWLTAITIQMALAQQVDAVVMYNSATQISGLQAQLQRSLHRADIGNKTYISLHCRRGVEHAGRVKYPSQELIIADLRHTPQAKTL